VAVDLVRCGGAGAPGPGAPGPGADFARAGGWWARPRPGAAMLFVRSAPGLLHLAPHALTPPARSPAASCTPTTRPSPARECTRRFTPALPRPLHPTLAHMRTKPLRSKPPSTLSPEGSHSDSQAVAHVGSVALALAPPALAALHALLAGALAEGLGATAEGAHSGVLAGLRLRSAAAGARQSGMVYAPRGADGGGGGWGAQEEPGLAWRITGELAQLRVALLLPRAGGGGAGGGGGGIGDAALARELFEEVLAPPTSY